MGYINKEFLETQFKNFATRISTIFAKKTDLPTVNEGKLTLKQNGTTVASFSANSASDVEANIDNVVLTIAQSLTEEEKAQVRANIGAGSSSLQADQSYDPKSSNPQSGTAVKEAIDSVTKESLGLDNVTNDAQVKGLPSGTTAGHVVTWGADGYTVADSGFTIGTSVPQNAKFTDTTYEKATSTSDGLLSKEDKAKLDKMTKAPMTFQGSLGADGTITALPTASSDNDGWAYKVITAGTYAGASAKVGDMFISNGTEWIYIPSGDEPSGTVTSVNLTAGGGINVSGGPITSSGSITITNTGVRSISVNASTGTLSANTNGTSTDLLAVENSNIDFSTYFG